MTNMLRHKKITPLTILKSEIVHNKPNQNMRNIYNGNFKILHVYNLYKTSIQIYTVYIKTIDQ